MSKLIQLRKRPLLKRKTLPSRLKVRVISTAHQLLILKRQSQKKRQNPLNLRLRIRKIRKLMLLWPKRHPSH
jgi:bifunctional ADP-heptose synthase (sugar kinase/adenylyltransferase)